MASEAATGDAALVVRWPGRRRLDLGREVHALLGLVFDAVTMDEALARLERHAEAGERCFFSTPNLNFAIGAQNDVAFRGSVLRSDLSLADGMPIVWLARLLGLPIRERVAGSDLFERLAERPPMPGRRGLGVFFFGGPDGAAEAAGQKLDARGGALRCVGFDAPGFVAIEAMSDVARIERINTSGADFLVVALGAKKGQAWIERNLERLTVPLISHLGAVVNFVAGNVSRAPRWMQRAGLEWLWRIREEPGLWRRYADDGLAFARLGATRLLPWVVRRLFERRGGAPGGFVMRPGPRGAVFHLAGDWRAARLTPLRRALAEQLNTGTAVQLDLSQATRIDSALIGLLLLLDAWQPQPRALTERQSVPAALRHCLRGHGAESLLVAATARAAALDSHGSA